MQRLRFVLRLRWLAIISLVLATIVFVGSFDSSSLQLSFMTMLVAAHFAVTIVIGLGTRRLVEHGELLSIPLALAQDREILDLFRRLSLSLRNTSTSFDPIYRDLALERLRQIDKEVSSVARGHIVFMGTETWRMAYERLLRSRGLYLYRSIALVKTANYWQDEPGRQSMEVNYAMQADRLQIERIAVVADHLWPTAERFPVEPILTWLDEQHRHGIAVKLVRQSSVSKEPDLAVDLGIYGNRAVGFQEVDDQGRTICFTLSFDFSEVLAAEQRWDRLSVYATSYRQLLEASTRL